jgi:hypothetical protein
MVLEYNSWKPFQQQNGFGQKFGEEGTKKIKIFGGCTTFGGCARNLEGAREIWGR